MSDRTLTDILERWRALERELADADPGGDDFARLEDEINRLRTEYRRVSAGAVATTDQLHAASRETDLRLTRSVENAEASREMLRRWVQKPDGVTNEEDATD